MIRHPVDLDTSTLEPVNPGKMAAKQRISIAEELMATINSEYRSNVKHLSEQLSVQHVLLTESVEYHPIEYIALRERNW